MAMKFFSLEDTDFFIIIFFFSCVTGWDVSGQQALRGGEHLGKKETANHKSSNMTSQVANAIY